VKREERFRSCVKKEGAALHRPDNVTTQTTRPRDHGAGGGRERFCGKKKKNLLVKEHYQLGGCERGKGRPFSLFGWRRVKGGIFSGRGRGIVRVYREKSLTKKQTSW